MEQKKQDMGEQYLLALIKCAGWVEEPYKTIAEAYKGKTEILKELYMCACDGVPFEKIGEAEARHPMEGALRLVRRKHLSNFQEESKEIAELKETTVTIEKEVKQMSGILKDIMEHVPDLDTLFSLSAEKDETPDTGEWEPAGENVPNFGTQQSEQKMNPEELTAYIRTEHDVSEEQMETEPVKNDMSNFDIDENGKEDVPNFGTQESKSNMLSRIRKKLEDKGTERESKKITQYVQKLIEEGYEKEQLDYLLNCLEEGLSISDIEEFASPKLPVEVMKRLRKMRKEK